MPVCCYKCIHCPEGAFSNQTGSLNLENHKYRNCRELGLTGRHSYLPFFPYIILWICLDLDGAPSVYRNFFSLSIFTRALTQVLLKSLLVYSDTVTDGKWLETFNTFPCLGYFSLEKIWLISEAHLVAFWELDRLGRPKFKSPLSHEATWVALSQSVTTFQPHLPKRVVVRRKESCTTSWVLWKMGGIKMWGENG